MLGTRNPRDVTYYEQLGLNPQASPEEIRHAYRSLVRILHPDHQTDPELKAAAERQLRKLNRIHAVLIDPAQRRAYDETLGQKTSFEAADIDESKIRRRTNLIRSAWIVGAVLTLFLIYWLGSESSPVEPLLPASRAQPGRPAIIPKQAQKVEIAEIERVRRDLASAIAERDAALREVARVRAKRPAVPAEPAVPTETTTPSATPPKAAAPPPTPAASKPPLPLSAPKMNGSWFYVPPKQGQQNKNKALYPPEFIELRIVGEAGNSKSENISGRYRSRYRVVDLPISPDVNFEITGKESGGTCICSWRGIGGAHGQITLQLTGENAMKIDWTAAELGAQQGLASGTAILARRPMDIDR